MNEAKRDEFGERDVTHVTGMDPPNMASPRGCARVGAPETFIEGDVRRAVRLPNSQENRRVTS